MNSKKANPSRETKMFQFKLIKYFSVQPKLNRTFHFSEEEKKGLWAIQTKKRQSKE